MLQIQAKIVSNTQIARGYFKMCLDAPAVAQKAEPGQFIYVHTSNEYQPLLRRAFSVHKISHQPPVTSHQLKNKEKLKQMEILYRVRGEGTRILAEKKAGEELDIIGPLGKGFALCPLPFTLYPVLVGGGVGIAPLVFLAQNLAKNRKPRTTSLRGRPKTENRILVLIGAKTKKEILCKDEFERLGCEVKVATDDGSQGFKGKVTELLRNILACRSPFPVPRIYACGPRPMLKEIAQLAQQYEIPCQVSLEERMACGVGACRGCVIKAPSSRLPRTASLRGRHASGQKTKKPENSFVYKRVCKDGPVFETGEIIWE